MIQTFSYKTWLRIRSLKKGSTESPQHLQDVRLVWVSDPRMPSVAFSLWISCTSDRWPPFSHANCAAAQLSNGGTRETTAIFCYHFEFIRYLCVYEKKVSSPILFNQNVHSYSFTWTSSVNILNNWSEIFTDNFQCLSIQFTFIIFIYISVINMTKRLYMYQ